VHKGLLIFVLCNVIVVGGGKDTYVFADLFFMYCEGCGRLHGYISVR